MLLQAGWRGKLLLSIQRHSQGLSNILIFLGIAGLENQNEEKMKKIQGKCKKKKKIEEHEEIFLCAHPGVCKTHYSPVSIEWCHASSPVSVVSKGKGIIVSTAYTNFSMKSCSFNETLCDFVAYDVHADGICSYKNNLSRLISAIITCCVERFLRNVSDYLFVKV